MGAEEPCAPRLPTAGLDFSASLEMTLGRCGGMTLGRYVGRAAGRALARDAQGVLCGGREMRSTVWCGKSGGLAFARPRGPGFRIRSGMTEWGWPSGRVVFVPMHWGQDRCDVYSPAGHHLSSPTPIGDPATPGDLSTVHNRVSACAPDGQPQSPGAKTRE